LLSIDEERMKDESIRYLPPPEASAYLRDRRGISRTVATLAKIRCIRNDGPEFVRDGHRILYPVSGLNEYAERVLSALRRSTREVAA
jgi:hypothetical protein